MPASAPTPYALAGALAVRLAEVLRTVHAVAGPPDQDPLTGGSRDLLVAAEQARAAAGACSAVAARLLAGERERAMTRLPELGAPRLLEPGVTVLEPLATTAWSSTVRAVAAAQSETRAAEQRWRQLSNQGDEHVIEELAALGNYLDQLTLHLEQHRPAQPSSESFTVASPASVSPAVESPRRDPEVAQPQTQVQPLQPPWQPFDFQPPA